MALSALSWHIISMLSLFEYITQSSALPLKGVKLVAIFNGIFHVSDFLRSFMISSKYGVLLLVYNNLLFPAQKGS